MRLSIMMLAVAVFFMTVMVSGADEVGTWKFNPAKSKFDPGPGPKSATVKIEAQGDGIKYTSDAVTPDGKSVHTEFSAKYDGKDNPITGSPDVDTIALKRIDANTTEGVTKKAGKVLGTAKVVISKDGKTRTMTGKERTRRVRTPALPPFLRSSDPCPSQIDNRGVEYLSSLRSERCTGIRLRV
jgi:hypothetical protein